MGGKEENGCEGLGKGYKPYKVKYRLTTVETSVICMKDGDDTLKCVEDVLNVDTLELWNFNIEILEKKEVKHIDDN